MGKRYRLRSVVLVAAFSVLLPALPGASEEPVQPGASESLAQRDPSEVLSWRSQRLAINQPGRRSLSAVELTLLSELVRTLNVAVDQGLVTVGRDFDVHVTAEGQEYFRVEVPKMALGCVEVTNVSATWLGFNVETQPTCSAVELDRRLADVGLPTSQTLAGVGSSTPQTKAGSPQIQANGFISSEAFGCWLAVIGLVVSVVAILVTLATGPLGLLATISLAASVAGGILSYIGIVRNCTGVLSVNARNYSGGVYTTRTCGFQYYSNYRWSTIAGRNVPTYVRYSCYYA